MSLLLVLAACGSADPPAGQEEQARALSQAAAGLAGRGLLAAPSALRQLEGLARMAEPPAGALELLADAYVHLDRHRDGLRFFDELRQSRPDDREALRWAAFFRHGYPELQQEAVVLHERLIETDRSDRLGYDLYARFLHDKRLYERALEVLHQGLERHPEDRGLLNQLGLTYLRMGREEEAEAIFRALTEDHPTYKYGFLNLGYLELGRGNLREAARQFRKVRLLDPRDAEAIYNLGRIAVWRGDAARARYMARLLRVAVRAR